jgi:hypothetical protein
VDEKQFLELPIQKAQDMPKFMNGVNPKEMNFFVVFSLDFDCQENKKFLFIVFASVFPFITKYC